MFNGIVHRFYIWGEPSQAQELGLLESFWNFSIHVAAVDFMVSRIGPIAPLKFLMDHFGPTRDTI